MVCIIYFPSESYFPKKRFLIQSGESLIFITGYSKAFLILQEPLLLFLSYLLQLFLSNYSHQMLGTIYNFCQGLLSPDLYSHCSLTFKVLCVLFAWIVLQA